jgi:hypothetical protein
MDDNRQNKVGDPDPVFLSKLTKLEENLLSEQHVTPTLDPKGFFCIRSRGVTFSTVVHWTVRLKVTNMERKSAGILLKVLAVEFCNLGLDFTGYLSVEFLVTFLMGKKTDFLEIRDEKDRQAVMLGNLILSGFRGNWLDLSERIKLSPKIIQEMVDTGWLPDGRTFASWRQYHNPRSFLQILTVPMDLYEERDSTTTRYSGYTKGYGNGGHVSRTKKTSYTAELDGDNTEPEPPRFVLTEIAQYNQLLLAIEREKLERRFGSKD